MLASTDMDIKKALESKILAVKDALNAWHDTKSLYTVRAADYINFGVKSLADFAQDEKQSFTSKDAEKYSLYLFVGYLMIALSLAPAAHSTDSANQPLTTETFEGLHKLFMSSFKVPPQDTTANFANFIGQAIIDNHQLVFDKDKLLLTLSYKMHQHLRIVDSYIHAATPRPLPTETEMTSILKRHKDYATSNEHQLDFAARLENTFQKAIKACQQSRAADQKAKLIQNIADLREKTLEDHRNKIINFSDEQYMQLATGVEQLALKVNNNTLSQLDCEKFHKATAPFRKSAWCSDLLCSILTIALAIAAGATAGFFIASTPGLLVGAMGLFTVTAVADAYLTKRKYDKDPLAQIVHFADEAAKPKI